MQRRNLPLITIWQAWLWSKKLDPARLPLEINDTQKRNDDV